MQTTEVRGQKFATANPPFGGSEINEQMTDLLFNLVTI